MFDNGYFWIFVVFFIIWGPFTRGRWGRRRSSERPPVDETARQAQMDQLEGRVAELESRLDFAERLLAAHREKSALPNREA